MNEKEKDQLLNDIINDEEKIDSKNRKNLQEHLKYKIGIIDNVFIDPIKFFAYYIHNRTKTGVNLPEAKIKLLLQSLTDPNNELDFRTGNHELDLGIEKSFKVMLKYTQIAKVQQKFLDFLEEENQQLKEKLRETHGRRTKKRN